MRRRPAAAPPANPDGTARRRRMPPGSRPPGRAHAFLPFRLVLSSAEMRRTGGASAGRIRSWPRSFPQGFQGTYIELSGDCQEPGHGPFGLKSSPLGTAPAYRIHTSGLNFGLIGRLRLHIVALACPRESGGPPRQRFVCAAPAGREGRRWAPDRGPGRRQGVGTTYPLRHARTCSGHDGGGLREPGRRLRVPRERMPR